MKKSAIASDNGKGNLRAEVAVFIGCLLFPGCAWRVVPPQEVKQPVAVYLNEYGRHTRLALPGPGPQIYTEYGFGDWEFYGLERRSVWSGMAAILGLRSAAFSRRDISLEPSGEIAAEDFPPSRSLEVMVERARAEQLRQTLEKRWQGNPERVIRAFDGVPVSKDAGAYHLFRNSNHATASWLESLGCEIKGVPILSNFQESEKKH